MAQQDSNESKTVLLLGGTGKVAGQIAPQLVSAGFVPIVASRRNPTSSNGYTTVKFDWDDESTWNDALLGGGSEAVSSVFIVAPGYAAPGAMAEKLISMARKNGTRRFVLLSSSQFTEDSPALGEIHKLLREMGDRGEVEWAVLRPTWFQQNYATEALHRRAIKEENKLYSATGPGRMPVVSAYDIAAVAAHALTTSAAPNRDYVILGPELLDYTQLAATFTEVLGRKITYHELTEQELMERHISFGLPKEYAPILASLDTIIRNGAEDRINNLVEEVTGRRPRSFRQFVEEEKETWM
ncbi:hypothetical protein Micbo1qcDRAFT_195479 [Microdochium bolleyi]|uniref:NmrA-like domain-containing protein n=1 Tax=Microdochium bolleyi TaxID=196109 RepID=A0A136J2A4_9PEZI|nr:hypothetical protein Micbo1qcDRAFT_195479 [Microdochium bolleyi]